MPHPNTHLCHCGDEISQAETGDEVPDGQDEVFSSMWDSCMQLHTYMDNESRGVISFYVLTLNV